MKPEWIGNDKSKILWSDGRILSANSPEWYETVQPWLRTGGIPDTGTNWEGLLQEWQSSGLDDILSTSKDQRNLTRIDLVFTALANYSLAADTQKLKRYWNKVITALPTALTPAQISQANQIASTHQAPFSLSPDGKMRLNQDG